MNTFALLIQLALPCDNGCLEQDLFWIRWFYDDSVIAEALQTSEVAQVLHLGPSPTEHSTRHASVQIAL
mgnify:CR=1 FL=1